MTENRLFLQAEFSTKISKIINRAGMDLGFSVGRLAEISENLKIFGSTTPGMKTVLP